MSEELLNRLIAGFGAGLGLLLAGGISLLLLRKSLWLRLGVAGATAIAGGLLPAFFVPPMVALCSAGVSVSAILIVTCMSSIRFASVLGILSRFFRRPVGQALILVGSGAVVMAGSIAQLDRAEEESLDQDEAWMAEAAAHPDLQVVPNVDLKTDRGRIVVAHAPITARSAEELDTVESRTFNNLRASGRVICTGPPNDADNCHGWVFTGGKYWIAPDDVKNILVDNGYEAVSDPRPGDLVIYHQGEEIVHTAIVNSALPGRKVMVEGKWGWMGVFLHAADDCCYGRDYKFYRSPRHGHLLIGSGGAAESDHHVVPDHSHSVKAN